MSDQNTTQSKKKGCLIASLVIVGIIVTIIVLTVGGCGLLAYGINESIEEAEREKLEQAEGLKEETPVDIQPFGVLKKQFDVMSQHTDIQREKAEAEIIGKVVQWKLNVFEVSDEGAYYRIQTQNDHNVGTFISLYPQSDEERQAIEKLMTDDSITVKGIITGVLMRNIQIDPAILIR